MENVGINENTTISAKILWTAIGTVVGATIWLTSLFIHQQVTTSRVEALDQRLEVIDRDRLKKREDITEIMHRIDNRLARIEGKLNIQDNTK